MAYYAFSSLRREHRSRARCVVRAGVDPTTSIARSRRSTQRSQQLGADGPTETELAGDAAVPDRIDSADARDQPEHRGRFCRPRSSSASGSTTTGACPTCSSAVTLDDVRAAAPTCSIPSARPSSIAGPEPPSRRPMTDGHALTTRGLLRRRLHADLPRPGVPGDRLPRLLRALRHRRRSRRRSTLRSPARRRCSRRRRADSTTPSSSSPTRAASSKGWAARGPAVDAVRARHLRRMGRVPSLRAVRRCARGAAQLHASRTEDRPDLELAPLPGVLPVATSSSKGCSRSRSRRLEHGYMKPHPSIFEAALQAARCDAGRGGDGRRQPAARRRGRAAPRDARRPRSRSPRHAPAARPGVPIIESLRQLPELLELQTPSTR